MSTTPCVRTKHFTFFFCSPLRFAYVCRRGVFSLFFLFFPFSIHSRDGGGLPHKGGTSKPPKKTKTTTVIIIINNNKKAIPLFFFFCFTASTCRQARNTSLALLHFWAQGNGGRSRREPGKKEKSASWARQGKQGKTSKHFSSLPFLHASPFRRRTLKGRGGGGKRETKNGIAEKKNGRKDDMFTPIKYSRVSKSRAPTHTRTHTQKHKYIYQCLHNEA
jgi:hypothetical protein